MVKTKKTALLLAVVMLMTIGLTGATAQEETVNVHDENKNLVKSIVFKLGHDHYYVNGQAPGVKMDAVPYNSQDRIFVPIRYLSNALGVTGEHIAWLAPNVILDEPGFPVVQLAVGSTQLKTDGTVTTMDVSPLAKDGRTYLPARWVAEALGYTVDWDAANSIVVCYPKGSDKPDVSNVVEHINNVVPQPVQPQVEPKPLPVQQESPYRQDMPKGDYRDFKDLNGVSLNPNDYVVAERKGIPYVFKQPGAKRVDITVEELKKHPVLMGDDGYKIIYDMNVQKDKISVKQASEGFAPASLILAKGNDVSVQRNNTIVKYGGNPFTHSYTMSLDADPGGGTKIEDVTHIMLLYSNQVLAIQNPLYKEGK